MQRMPNLLLKNDNEVRLKAAQDGRLFYGYLLLFWINRLLGLIFGAIGAVIAHVTSAVIFCG